MWPTRCSHSRQRSGPRPKFSLSMSDSGGRHANGFMPNATLQNSRRYLANFRKVREVAERAFAGPGFGIITRRTGCGL